MLFEWSTNGSKRAQTLGVMLLTSGCFVAVNDGPPEKKFSERDFPQTSDFHLAMCPSEAQRKVRYEEEKSRPCFEDETYRWRPTCRSSDCQEVPVYVNYQLTEDLGKSVGIAVEAFDNPRFVGSPVSTARIGHFDASRAGGFQQTVIYLSPSQYYLRAYVANDDESIVPYEYQSMNLISNRPLGVYGALSSPQSIDVRPRNVEHFPAPIHLNIDKLFQKPGTEPKTNAHLRLLLSATEQSLIAPGRKIIINLHADENLQMAPAYHFELQTERMLVTGQVGRAEFVTPDLKAGKYILFVYVDSNGNGFRDSSELAQIYKKLDQPAFVVIVNNQTLSLPLELVKDPALPPL